MRSSTAPARVSQYPVSVAIAVIDAVGAALAMRGTRQTFDFELHQALRGKTHHLAQQIGIRALLQQRAQAHHLVGHRRVLGSRYGSATKPYRRSTMTTAVDKCPVAARLVTVAAAGHLPTAPTPPQGTRPKVPTPGEGLPVPSVRLVPLGPLGQPKTRVLRPSLREARFHPDGAFGVGLRACAFDAAMGMAWAGLRRNKSVFPR